MCVCVYVCVIYMSMQWLRNEAHKITYTRTTDQQWRSYTRAWRALAQPSELNSNFNYADYY